jgi:hypothetical protein
MGTGTKLGSAWPAISARSAAGKPIQRIEQTVKPREQQEHTLENLKAVSAKAAEELRASCPTEIAENPVPRLDAMSDRLHAMVLLRVIGR